MLRETVLVFAALVVLASATQVNHCDSGIPFEDSSQIQISNCDQPECQLKQGTNATIEIKLVPSRNIATLTNEVYGILFNVPLPFVGVDSTDACDDLYKPDGSKTSCPLEKDKEYIYRNSFPILQFYPRVSLVVRYALREGNERLICFEVGAKITK